MVSELATLRDNRSFRWLVAAQAARAMGFWLFWLGMLSLASFTLKASAGQVALITTAGSAAFVLLSPFTGTLVDRTNAKWTLAGCFVITAAAALWLSQATEIWHVYIASFVSACAGALFWPSLGALMKGLVPESSLARANGFINGVWEATLIVGPILSGFLGAQFGPRTPIVVGACIYVAAISVILPIRFVPAHRNGEAIASGFRGMREGFDQVLRLPDLRSLVAWGALAMGGFFVLIGIEPVFVRESLGGGQGMLGVFYSVGGVGATLGSLAVGRLVRSRGELPVGAAGLTVAGAFFGVYVLIARWPHVIPIQAIIGGAFAIYISSTQALVQRRVPPILVGRALSARRGMEECASVTGSLAGSAVASAIGARPTMAIAAGVMTFAGLCLMTRATRLHIPPRDPTEAVSTTLDPSSMPSAVVESVR